MSLTITWIRPCDIEAAGGPHQQYQTGSHAERWHFEKDQGGCEGGNAKEHHSLGNNPFLSLQIRHRVCRLCDTEVPRSKWRPWYPVFLVNDSVHNLTFVFGSVEVPLRVPDEAMFIQLPQLVSTNSNVLSGTTWPSVRSG